MEETGEKYAPHQRKDFFCRSRDSSFFTQILSFLGISGASQLCSQLIDLKLYLQSITEHFLSGINIRNNAVFLSSRPFVEKTLLSA
ncbi:hypothetical protein KZ770_26935 [Escherichia coli]|nr:hypothetical protein [Escherichia coli]MBW6091001.1 hypothetical protein [Escherichia coli]